MKCNSCGAVNPDGKKFCGDCGASLAPKVSPWSFNIPSLVVAIVIVCCFFSALSSLSRSTEPAPTKTIDSVAVLSKSTTEPTEIPPNAEAPLQTPTQLSLPTASRAPGTTSTNTRAWTSTPRPTDTPRPTNTSRPVQPAVFTFGDGIKIVGTDIPTGTYRRKGTSTCYWERLRGFGGTFDEIIANKNVYGPSLVTIAPSDKGFRSSLCGTWTQDLSPTTSSPAAPFGEGVFMVNKDIAPGTWKSTGTSLCYWERLKGFSGEFGDIIANGNPGGAAVVTISSSDVGFSSARCGTWSKIN